MANIKAYITNCDRNYKNMKIVYELAGKLSQSTNITPQERSSFLVRYKDIERFRQQFEEAFTIIMSSPEAMSDKSREELEVRYSAFMDMYYSIQVLHSSFETKSSNSTQQVSVKSEPGIHLPNISLSRYTGVYTEWPNFISIFNSLIHNNDSLSPIQKLHYLLSVLDKEPLSLVKHLVISNENYNVAYNLLIARYENKRVIADKHVEAILNLPTLAQLSLKNLTKFVYTIKENTQALNALNIDTKSWDFLLLHIILRKLSLELRSKFESQVDARSIPSFNNLITFLENQLYILENLNTCTHKASTSSSLTVVESKQLNKNKPYMVVCPCCQENHSIYHCSKFDAMTPEQRKSFVYQNKLCFNCLRTHHIAKCISRSVCGVCHGRHHTKLHIMSNTVRPNPTEEVAVSTLGSIMQLQSSNDERQFTMILGTVSVCVRDVNGQYHSARALIDNGSQVSIISESLAQQLRLPRTPSRCVLGLGASSAKQTRGTIHCHIKSVHDSSKFISTDCLIMKRITGNLPSVEVNSCIMDKCRNLVLADKNFSVPGQIDLLLGIDTYNQILDGKRCSLGDDMPTAHSSLFGWVIMGRAPAASQHSYSVISMACTGDPFFNLSRFWESEEPPSQPIRDPEDILCEKHFTDTHTRDDTGRFIVRLPFKVDHKPLGETHTTALKRFHNLERRMLKDDKLHELYVAFMKDYIEAGHMREVSTPVSRERYYIPHHGILREHSSTTKLRAVYDASASSSTGVSLNQILMSGPKLQKSIEDIILRFRIHKVVFTCDIKQMYRQVRMHNEDSLHIRVIHELAHINSSQHPEACRVLLEDTFVDDVVSGSHSFDSAQHLQQELVNILSQGGFALRKWSSNSKEFLELFASDHCEPPYRFEEHGDNVYKILGIEWNAKTDSFIYRVSNISDVMTMRGVLSNIARLYDPCGFLAPVTFYAKHIMQQLWASQCGWDDPLPPAIQESWSELISNFHQLDKVSIPRWVITNQPLVCQLHGFSDASERGYAACVYLRVQNAHGISTQLLLAKSRVAPLKQKLTIPKLELNGALLLIRLTKHVFDILNVKVKISSVVAWCDSSIVLSWLKTSPHKLQTYEGNRVSQIQNLFPDVTWKHVPSMMNPADPASRGLSPAELVDHPLWWCPKWLELDDSTWPDNIPDLSEAELPGMKSSPFEVYVTQTVDEFPALTKFSSFPKLQSVVAWCKRFIYNLRNYSQRRTGPLSVCELSASTHTIVRLVQSSEFLETSRRLREDKPLKGCLLRLNLFLDQDGLIRVGGRLINSNLPYNAKYPLLLPKTHHNVTQHIKNSHEEIHKHLARQQVVWHLNPPASPHMGGLWESAVRSAKIILTRVIGDRSLVFEELATIFAKVEAALNSRPLVPITNDSNDLDVLTPGHFLIGKPLQALPEEEMTESNLLKRWQLVRQITQHFWKRWQTEYLHTLQQRPKWLARLPNVQVGDLVLLKESALPPLRWKTARVTRVYPGSDGTVRVVELKTSAGSLLRPVTKICPLLCQA
ncbi:uncharacterized protein LOC128201271 [Galleria mellonella]|uniref:Uncharacterized protein LOC128201271 n=1 Tax=Galleria mellonella TaxID=7137 RepID=A0ABM3MR59_GALME|nr:uncharacterized protein LOC128201271 [Galleria mellonella]